ncbi:HNH endonuclease [Corynebacterium sp. zg254]|uniref:HNH endonuclease n=1 Tax=Corynebacterium zhongnanshanii TaxID=2768834 RepID=A0ABQ6VKF3_9CORY|nr:MULTISPECIES: HNH endonuclease signature motif containing protein [Corynebacterium]KAB3522961.1 HNH endonuclease [Corynebacterium zhongnanshanii]MCR5913957.1 HNH endonuclease [Corynebacterium sp. zg254]
MLAQFPTLMELLLTGMYLPSSVSRLAELLACIPEDLAAAVDLDVTDCLGPTVPNQYPLTPAQISARILPIVNDYCPENRLSEPPETHLQIKRSETSITFCLSVPLLEGQAIEKLIATTARTRNVSAAEALVLLIMGNADVSVTLNLFRHADNPDAPLVAAGTILDERSTKKWLDKVTHTRTLAPSGTSSYSPTAAQRAYIEARDVHCRFPGCTVPAHRCDIDHIHRYDGGGPTHTDNLHLLCRHHHKLKTAGIWDVTRYPDSSETWSSINDGHTVTTIANGPLARPTFAQRLR